MFAIMDMIFHAIDLYDPARSCEHALDGLGIVIQVRVSLDFGFLFMRGDGIYRNGKSPALARLFMRVDGLCWG